jgi:DNA-binding MarR family transcriptional regulator
VSAQRDVIDRLIDQWSTERPDLDFDAMATIARLSRFVLLGSRTIEETLQRHDLRIAEFDVLGSLRRLGSPYRATPTELTRALMLSPAGVTARLDRLERAGYVEREYDPADRRSLLVVLTQAGLDCIDAAVEDHLATEFSLLADLTHRQRLGLDGALRALLRQFDATEEG